MGGMLTLMRSVINNAHFDPVTKSTMVTTCIARRTSFRKTQGRSFAPLLYILTLLNPFNRVQIAMTSTAPSTNAFLSTTEEYYNVPVYIANQPPQDAFDALLTKIASNCSNDRTLVEEFVTNMKSPAYDVLEGPQPTESKDFLLIKKVVVEVLFEAIEKEDNQCIALLFQHGLVSAQTNGSHMQRTPLLQAISQKPINIGVIKQLLLLGADPNEFGYPDPVSHSLYHSCVFSYTVITGKDAVF